MLCCSVAISFILCAPGRLENFLILCFGCTLLIITLLLRLRSGAIIIVFQLTRSCVNVILHLSINALIVPFKRALNVNIGQLCNYNTLTPLNKGQFPIMLWFDNQLNNLLSLCSPSTRGCINFVLIMFTITVFVFGDLLLLCFVSNPVILCAPSRLKWLGHLEYNKDDFFLLVKPLWDSCTPGHLPQVLTPQQHSYLGYYLLLRCTHYLWPPGSTIQLHSTFDLICCCYLFLNFITFLPLWTPGTLRLVPSYKKQFINTTKNNLTQKYTNESSFVHAHNYFLSKHLLIVPINKHKHTYLTTWSYAHPHNYLFFLYSLCLSFNQMVKITTPSLVEPLSLVSHYVK